MKHIYTHLQINVKIDFVPYCLARCVRFNTDSLRLLIFVFTRVVRDIARVFFPFLIFTKCLQLRMCKEIHLSHS